VKDVVDAAPANDDVVIDLRGVAKHYSLEPDPRRRLWRQLTGRTDQGPVHTALEGIDLQVRRGEVVGLIGRNGAGKSTLLQVVCGVLQPTRGERSVRGRIAALLELGAGFNPELTGRENVRLNGPLLGLKPQQIEERLPEIVEFAGIGEFIDQPVRSYSSGMFVRLAFSMATSVEPDILVIDEALSVGDGAFARKSFERIMALRDRGATILFCSHALFQVEALCPRALWLQDGRVRFDGPTAHAVVEYQTWLDRQEMSATTDVPAAGQGFNTPQGALLGLTFGRGGSHALLQSGRDDLRVRVRLRSDPTLPSPTLGVVIHAADGRSLASAGTWMDGVPLQRDAAGRATVEVRFPALPLLKGRYTVSAYLLCERALNVLSAAEHVLTLEVEQDHLEQGMVTLPRDWTTHAGADEDVDEDKDKEQGQSGPESP
jgi:lipopolysaccharide transport system ATP-binding protein